MEEALRQIAKRIRRGEDISPRQLEAILRRESRNLAEPSKRLSKRALMAYYMQQRGARSAIWRSLGLTKEQDDAMIGLLRAKPRRTASGVATVTVLTKPWSCRADCLYCPNDIRMPKSYLWDEPACQRAERCHFDPYLQVGARLGMLHGMGHNTDKVELIVLGGTWFDYPYSYRLWFASQLFRALDDFGTDAMDGEMDRRRRIYENAPQASGDVLSSLQMRVNEGELTYAEALGCLPAPPNADDLADVVSEDALMSWQRANERAQARSVGLVIETRPDTITDASLVELRTFGVTKVQMGIQSLDADILRRNCRCGSVDQVEEAMGLLRLFGFKSHVHMMANLAGSTPEADVEQYRRLVGDERYLPDEIKLYPCALVESAHLTDAFGRGEWEPYSEEALVGLLAACVEATPAHTRISRMIRDIPSQDILTGCQKTNLRQVVEAHIASEGQLPSIQEMRMREVATRDMDAAVLHLEEVAYVTTNTDEVFLQWVDEAGTLAAFLRLSLPRIPSPATGDDAMIREVHVYGRTSRMHESREGNQHLGLGRKLIERACHLAREDGRETVSVISAVGTRAYYRRLGFEDAGLYQRRTLDVSDGDLRRRRNVSRPL